MTAAADCELAVEIRELSDCSGDIMCICWSNSTGWDDVLLSDSPVSGCAILFIDED